MPSASRGGAQPTTLSDPGDARDRDRHDGGADQRILAAGNVAADAADRDQLLAEEDAGRELDLERLQTVALAPGEALDLRLAVREVLLERLGQAAGDRADLLLGHPEVALPAIELPGECPDCLVTAIPDLGEHGAHALLDGAMAVRLPLRGPFEVVAHPRFPARTPM